MMLQYLSVLWESGSSTNSVKGFESNTSENSSPDVLQLVIDGDIVRYILKALCKRGDVKSLQS